MELYVSNNQIMTMISNHDILAKPLYDIFQMNEEKCKELQIGFSKVTNQYEPIKIHHNPLEVVKSA